MSPTRSNSPTGGARADGMYATSQQELRIAYPDASDSRARRVAELKSLFVGCARYAFDRLPHAAQRDKDFLQAVIKGRYDFQAESRLLGLLVQTDAPHMLAESVHGETLRLMPVAAPCPFDALVDEAGTNAPADVAGLQFFRERTVTRARQLLDFLTQQYHATGRAIDALHLYLRRTA